MQMRRLATMLLPVGLAAGVACGTDDLGAGPAAADDGGADGTAPAKGEDASATDAGTLDCAGDTSSDGVERHLECTGLYASLAEKTVAADVRAYQPGAQLWSDGAAKSRWIRLPAGSKIDITSFEEWRFPVGTKVWKEFQLGGKRVETRYFTKVADGDWRHTTYRWNADETTAVRKDIGEKLAGLGPDGGTYEIPTSGQCDDCHNGRQDRLLGFEAVGLGLPNATGLTLPALADAGLLSAAPPQTSFTLPGDATAQAALSFLHANCGACHNGNTTALAQSRAHLLLHAAELTASATVADLDVYKQIWCKPASRVEASTGKAYAYVRGGAPTRSLVSVLSGFRVPEGQDPDDRQMPPIVSRAVDGAGHTALDAWIASLPACAE